MIYNISIKAQVESDLPQNKLESQLVVALHDTDNQYSKFDGADDNLRVIDYEDTEANEVCPHCNIQLVPRVCDIDGTNLVDCDICDKCGYGTPALR